MKKIFVLLVAVMIISGCVLNREIKKEAHTTPFSPLHFVDQKHMWDSYPCGKSNVYLVRTNQEEEHFLMNNKKFVNIFAAAVDNEGLYIERDSGYMYMVGSAEFPSYYAVWTMYSRVDGTILKMEDAKICK